MKKDDSFGVELDLKIDKFKSKMKEAQNISKETGKKIAENSKFGVWKDDVYTLSNGMQFVKKSTSELNNEIEDTGKVTKQAGSEISQAFNKGLKSVKKLTLGFLGARTAFSLFRKYMSNYQNQNEVFAQKMQLTTNVITNALAPAFELFANVIQYVVIGLARVVELLFGVNILGKTVDNSLKGASQSAKELNDNLSGLDEISNIDQSSTNGLASGLTGQLEALEEFKKKIGEVDAFFKEFKIDKIILGIRDAFKSIWGWASDHPILATAFVTGLIALKTGILPGVVKALTGAGKLSLLGAFKFFLGAGITIGILEIADNLSNLEDSVSKVAKKLEIEAGAWQKSADARLAYMKATGQYTEEETKETLSDYDKSIQALEKERKEWKKLRNLKTWIIDPGQYIEAGRQLDEIDRKIDQIKRSQAQVNVSYEITNDKIGSNVKMTENMKKITEDTRTKAEAVSNLAKEWEQNIGNADYKLNNLKKTFSTGFNAPVTLDFDTAQTRINFKNFIENSPLLKGIKTLLPGFTKNILASYDVGTDYVPRDQIAMVHEGERIIPKKYNNSEYLGNLGNSETNDLLIELNKSVLEFAKRPSVISVNGKELAKATYNDYQEESARRGTNISVRRV